MIKSGTNDENCQDAFGSQISQNSLDNYFKVLYKKCCEIVMVAKKNGIFVHTSDINDLSHVSSNLIDILRLLEISLIKEVEKLNIYQQDEFGADSMQTRNYKTALALVKRNRKNKRTMIKKQILEEERINQAIVNKEKLFGSMLNEVQKGRPMMEKAKKKKLKKTASSKNKLNQADLDFNRYIGKIHEEQNKIKK